MEVPTLCYDLSHAIIYPPERSINSLAPQHCHCFPSIIIVIIIVTVVTVLIVEVIVVIIIQIKIIMWLLYVSHSLVSSDGTWECPPGMEATNVINIPEDGGFLTGNSSRDTGTGLSVPKVMSLEEL